MPEADAAAEAGRLVQQLPELWAGADITERRRLVLTVLEAGYVDARGGRAVASIRPKAAFKLLLEEAQTHVVGGVPSAATVNPTTEYSVRLSLSSRSTCRASP